MVLTEYTWLFGVGLFVAFWDSFGIGANDVSNSFATAVGSRSLTLKQACCIAIFTEFFGAFLLGGNTAQTIRSGILKDSALFQNNPEVLMLAMVCALLGSATWVLTATRFGWPVSTTHAVVGAIIGVGIASTGFDGLDLSANGIPRIITSWFLSPFLAGLMAATIFIITRQTILVKPDSLKRGFKAVPVYFGVVFSISLLYVLLHGPKTKDIPTKITLPLCVILGALIILFVRFFLVNWLQRKLVLNERVKFYHLFVAPFLPPQPQLEDEEKHGHYDVGHSTKMGENEGMLSKLRNFMLRGVNQEVADHDSQNLKEIHDKATRYDEKTEYLYSFLQVMTSCFASFAHGSNDVANAVGPLATIYHVYSTGTAGNNNATPVPVWTLIYGGICIDLGLLLYGYNVMRSLGNKITYHSPSRGFCMEFGTTLTVLTASKLGLPVSTTHCITGATAAVGLCNDGDGGGIRERAKALNWKMLGWCFFSWIITLPMAAIVSGLIFSFAVKSPKLVS